LGFLGDGRLVLLEQLSLAVFVSIEMLAALFLIVPLGDGSSTDMSGDILCGASNPDSGVVGVAVHGRLRSAMGLRIMASSS
jgi:hypothetical protein